MPSLDSLTHNEQRLVRVLKALGNPTRIRILEYLAAHPTCMTQTIVLTTPLAQSTVSQHLKVLREAGLVQGEIEGPATCYCIDPAGLEWLRKQLGDWMGRIQFGPASPDVLSPSESTIDIPAASSRGQKRHR
jgi:ArsR family transcriptional regulator